MSSAIGTKPVLLKNLREKTTRERNMSNTKTSQSILDNNGLLITEPANEEPDQEVEDELLRLVFTSDGVRVGVVSGVIRALMT